MNDRYAMMLKPISEADGGGYVALVPDLPGCKSDGDTLEQALRNARDAIECWIEAAEEAGRPVPPPTLVYA